MENVRRRPAVIRVTCPFSPVQVSTPEYSGSRVGRTSKSLWPSDQGISSGEKASKSGPRLIV
eukprot:366131-Chlamydomonas_euryale.AAC.16